MSQRIVNKPDLLFQTVEDVEFYYMFSSILISLLSEDEISSLTSIPKVCTLSKQDVKKMVYNYNRRLF